ncbi:MAG TPA: hypothetical protein PKK06_06110 [Phycisphaerae bacterium]|nr:hypothetical protein [Phycisphaerae bacterium]HNU44232.1 hypothetical protein [Phycisphaerae bacterium]
MKACSVLKLWLGGLLLTNLLWVCPAQANDVDDPPPEWDGRGSSPFPAPTRDDRTFVVDAGSGLDTECLFRSQGPLIITCQTTRYLGPTYPDGRLVHAEELIARGLISRYAVISMPVSDVDYDCLPYSTPPCERDRASFNGVPMNMLDHENSEFLQGVNNQWRLNSFRVPIQFVLFPEAPGTGGDPPIPRDNIIRIDIDTANFPEERWCTAIDWVTIEIQCMSPVILIHGNESDGGFFARRGFTTGLDAQFLLWNNTIDLPTAARMDNGGRLSTQIPPIVRQFGVDSVHLVCHSKGGLDTREFLDRYYPAHRNTFKILSYTTLSTPHNGSVLADVAETHRSAAVLATYVEFDGLPGMANALAYLTRPDPGRPDLRTNVCAAFNRGNIGRLPGDIVYNTVAADADTNGNAMIDYYGTDEYAALRAESIALAIIHSQSVLLSREIVDTLYQVLRNTSAVTLSFRRVNIGVGSITVATMTGVPNPVPLGNDTLVTVPSGVGLGSLQPRVTNTFTFLGAAGRNHANVADAGVAATVSPWLVNVERANGDLKPR